MGASPTTCGISGGFARAAGGLGGLMGGVVVIDIPFNLMCISLLVCISM